MRISDWSSDVCSSDLTNCGAGSSRRTCAEREAPPPWPCVCLRAEDRGAAAAVGAHPAAVHARGVEGHHDVAGAVERDRAAVRSEEHTSELQSLMRISYAVFCLKKKTNNKYNDNTEI